MGPSATLSNTLLVDVLGRFFNTLTIDTMFANQRSHWSGINILGNIAFALLVWIAHCLSICFEDEEACQNSFIVGAPFKMLTSAEIRDFLLEYVWLYMGTSLVYQALVCGTRQTLRGAAGATRRETRPGTGRMEKTLIYLYHVFAFGYHFILQPWIILEIALEAGKEYSTSRTHGALLSIYTALGLHLLMTLCGTIDQLSCPRGLVVFDSKFWLVVGLALAMIVRKEYLDPLSCLVQSSWDGARKYSNTARIAEENLRTRVASLNTA